MGNMEHVDSMTIVGTRLPVVDNPYWDFRGDEYSDNITDMSKYDVSPEWYHALNDHMDYMSYCEYISTPIDIEDLLDTNDNVKSLSEEETKARKDVIKDHLDKQKKQLAGIEENDQWKFLSEPEKYPFEQEIIISGRRIKKVYKTPQARDSLLDGYNENSYQECFNNNYKYLDGDEGDLDRAAKENIIFMKYLHKSITNSIEVNTKNLNKLEFAQSSVFAIPSPNVPTLSYGVGSNSPVTQTANDNITKSFENTLGAIRDGLAETFDCSFGMSCSNDMDKAAKNPNVGKELAAEENEVLGILGGSVSVSPNPNGLEPDDERFKQQEIQTSNRKNEIKELFEYDNSRSGIQIGNRTLIEMPNKGNAKIFNGASVAEIKQYFVELTGNKTFPEVRTVPGKGNIYTVKTPNGSFNLRDFSSSASETGKAWTIDIPKGVAKDTAPVEIKFLK